MYRAVPDPASELDRLSKEIPPDTLTPEPWMEQKPSQLCAAASFQDSVRLFRVHFLGVTLRFAKCPPDPSPTQRPSEPSDRSLNSSTTRDGVAPLLT